MRLRPRLQPRSGAVEWVTSDGDQRRSLLAGEQVHHLSYVAPRHAHVVVHDLPEADRILRFGHYDRVVTTGSAMALSVLLAARRRGIPCHWIESSARATGPSLTGRIVSRIPGMHLYTQYPSWATGAWSYRGSVLDDYEPTVRAAAQDGMAHRVVVTFGTMRTYPFDRAARALIPLLRQVAAPDAQILWQTGVSDVSDLGIDGKESVPASELRTAIQESDLVIAHAGVGSALTALDLGRAPVLLTRRKSRAEMVDDHQVMIAQELSRRGVAIGADPDDLTADDLARSMTMGVAKTAASAPFELDE